MTTATPLTRGGARALLVGGGGLRPGLQPATFTQPDDLGLAEIPELAPALGVDLSPGRKLTQPLMADLQLVGGNSQGDQAVLRHGRDSSGYANSLPRRGLLFAKITGKIVGVIQSNKEDVAGSTCSAARGLGRRSWSDIRCLTQ